MVEFNNPNVCNFYGACIAELKSAFFVFGFSSRGSLDVPANIFYSLKRLSIRDHDIKIISF